VLVVAVSIGSAAVTAAGATAAPTRTASAPVGFSRPYQIAAPVNRDRLAPVLAYSPNDTVAAAFGSFNEDEPGSSSASLATRRPTGSFGAVRTVPGAQQVLSLAYPGQNLELLAGTSPHVLEFGTLEPCCSKVEAIPVTPTGGFGADHTVVSGLNGATQADLIPFQGRLLAAVATEEGVWTAQSDTHGRFGPTRAMNLGGAFVEAMDAAAYGQGQTIVVWTARTSQFEPGPITIYDARGTTSAAPAAPAVAVTVPASHEIDQLVVAAHGSVPTVAWIESWFDSAGGFHSQAFAEDLAGRHIAQPLSSRSTLASGLALAAGAGDAQVVAFRACSTSGSCTVQAETRTAGRFGPAQTLGRIDGSQLPAVAESAFGTALVGWVNTLGNVDAAVATAPTHHFRGTYRASATGYAADLALAIAPSGTSATAVWTQGTLNESVVGSTFTGPPLPKTPPATKKKKRTTGSHRDPAASGTTKPY
jgi:hypothetical protein